jgi:hypothetical protein
MNEGEDRGRGANPQSERNHRGGGEAGRFSKSPKRLLQIRHFVSPDSVWRRRQPPLGLVSNEDEPACVSKSPAAFLSCNTQQDWFGYKPISIL